MSRNYSLYLYDILESCKKIRQYVSGMTFETFSTDEKTTDAVVRNLEVIGEAVKSIPPEMLSSRGEIDWKRIARFRDIIAHHYFKVDLEVEWDITQTRIGELEAAVSSLISESENSEPE